MCLLHIVADRLVQLGNPFHERCLCLRPMHSRQGIVEPFLHIGPSVDDPDVLQHLVGGHTGQIIERQPPFSR